MKITTHEIKEALKYKLQNCKYALEILKKVNNELYDDYINDNPVQVEDPNYLAHLNGIINECLVTRIHMLFDRNSTASFENLCPKDTEYIQLKNEPIIAEIELWRHNIAAHGSVKALLKGNIPSQKIINSNMPNILQQLEGLIDKY